MWSVIIMVRMAADTPAVRDICKADLGRPLAHSFICSHLQQPCPWPGGCAFAHSLQVTSYDAHGMWLIPASLSIQCVLCIVSIYLQVRYSEEIKEDSHTSNSNNYIEGFTTFNSGGRVVIQPFGLNTNSTPKEETKTARPKPSWNEEQLHKTMLVHIMGQFFLFSFFFPHIYVKQTRSYVGFAG